MGCGDGVRRRAEEPKARSRYGHGRAGAMWLLWRLLWRWDVEMGCAEEQKARQPLGTAPELHEFHGRPLRALRSH